MLLLPEPQLPGIVATNAIADITNNSSETRKYNKPLRNPLTIPYPKQTTTQPQIKTS